MGASESSQPDKEENDPWWPSNQMKHKELNVLEKNCSGHPNTDFSAEEETANGEELWLKQIQDLGKVVQHLACENTKLLHANKELQEKCDKAESIEMKLNFQDHQLPIKQEVPNQELIQTLEEEAVRSRALIHNLQQQIVNEVKNHEENKELQIYKQTIQKLEKESLEYINKIENLQTTLKITDEERQVAQENTYKLKSQLETLQQKQTEYCHEIDNLQKELVNEQKCHQKMLVDRDRLFNELQRAESEEHLHVSGAGAKDTKYAHPSENGIENDEQDGLESCQRSASLSPRATAELQKFQKELKVKRDARHRALSAISAEMERLRSELNAEREARKNVVKELDSIKNKDMAHYTFTEVDSLKSKLTSEREEKNRISKELIKIQKEGHEEIEHVLKELEKEKAKSQHMLEENKFIKEQLEESDQMLQQRSEENSQLQSKLQSDKEKYQQQVAALKDVIALTKQMLSVRENQVTYLKQTLQDIEASVMQKQHGSLTADLRVEYETQIQNIKALKTLYEERVTIMNSEKQKLLTEQEVLLQTLENEKKRSEILETQLEEKVKIITERNETVSNLQDQLSDSLDQSRNLSRELTLINDMFTQILGSTDMDLDHLTKLLQENHDLITEITTKGDCSETTASLPKLLLDLITDIQDTKENSQSEKELVDEAAALNNNEQSMNHNEENLNVAHAKGATLGTQEIASNLPKVWRVLMELISHHVPTSPDEFLTDNGKASCYKSIETPNGPINVISVSKTFLRLRDLILHKKSLQKEVTRLKELNVHLETKLNNQERRLSLVSSELRKTWSVVDHMRIQHQHLHTHEKVLRYELQQKRKLLNELKEELEYCREKWEDARQKNSQSETEWQKLRKEFALRKSDPKSALNNSEESGFSDEKEENSDSDVDQSQMCQRKSANDHSINTQATCLKATSTNREDNDSSLNESSSCASLPDLLSATSDHNFSDVEAVSSDLTNVFSEVELPDVSSQDSNLCPSIPRELEQTTPENNTSFSESHVLEECSTVSLITMLKQQLACFSRNLDMITNSLDSNETLKALQSIFTLPAIEIPEHLHPSRNNLSSKNSNNTTENILPKKLKYDKTDLQTETHFGRDQTHKYNKDDLQIKVDVSSTNFISELPSSSSSPKTSSTSLCNEEESNTCQTLSSNCQEVENNIDCEECLSDTTKLVEDAASAETVSTDGTSCLTENTEKRTSPQDNQFHDSTTNSTCQAEEIQRQTDRNITERRSARMQRLEKQCQELFQKVTQSSSNTANSPGTSTQTNVCEQSVPEKKRSLEDILDARAARLKRLEEQSQQLFKKVTRTTHRSNELSNRLEELHEHYGNDDNGTDENNASHLPSTSTSSANISPSSIPHSNKSNSTKVQGQSPNENHDSISSNSIPEPPPLPTTLPPVRLRTEIEPSAQDDIKPEKTTKR